MADVTVNIVGNDQLSPALQKADAALNELAQAEQKVTQSSQKTNDAIAEAQTGFSKLGGGLNDVVQEMTGFNIAQLTLVGGITMLGKGIKDAVQGYSDYVEGVDKMSQKTGVAAEDLSRLVQAADDFRVSEDTMRAAMDLAVQNGFIPSIDNLANLADKLQGIQDPIERANTLQDIFGKQWKEIYPLLEHGGQALRDQAAGISDGLVVTQAAIDANREFVKSLDDLGDAWTDVKNQFAGGLIPNLAGGLQIFAQNLEDLRKGKSIFEVLAGNQTDYAALDAKLKTVTGGEWDWNDAQRESMKVSHETGTAIVQEAGYLQLQRSQMQASQAVMERSADVTEKFKEETIKASDAYKNLRSAQEKAADAQANFDKSFGDKAVSSLEQAGVKGQKLADVYEQIDAKLGTHYAAQKRNEDAMNALAKQYASGQITAEQYAQGLEAQKPAWEAMDEGIQKTKQSLQEALTAFNNFISHVGAADGLRFEIYVNTISGGGGGGSGSVDQGRKSTYTGAKVGNAAGLNTVIPPGYPNDSFPLGLLGYAESGEEVRITPANEVVGGAYSTGGPMAGGTYVTNHVSAPVNIYPRGWSDAEVEDLAYRVTKHQDRQRRGG